MPPPHVLRAADPTTPVAELRYLATLAPCRDAVAGNPSTPVDVLEKVCPQHAQAVALNPAFALSLLADPAWLSRLDSEALWALARVPDCPGFLREALIDACYPARSVRVDGPLLGRLLERRDLTADDLARLVDRAFDTGDDTAIHHTAVRLSGDRRTPPAHLARLADVENPSAELFEALARHPHFPVEALPRLLDAFPERVGLVLARDPRTPGPLVMRLIGSTSVEVRRLARRHPDLPVAFGDRLDRLGFAPSMATGGAPPHDRPLSPEDMEHLYEGGLWFQLYLARRPDLPPALRERLFATAHPLLRRLLQSRKDAT